LFWAYTIKGMPYAISNDKMARMLQYASIKPTQANIQKYITWLKKSNKGKHKWEKP
jgi:hypothetical protein